MQVEWTGLHHLFESESSPTLCSAYTGRAEAKRWHAGRVDRVASSLWLREGPTLCSAHTQGEPLHAASSADVCDVCVVYVVRVVHLCERETDRQRQTETETCSDSDTGRDRGQRAEGRGQRAAGSARCRDICRGRSNDRARVR